MTNLSRCAVSFMYIYSRTVETPPPVTNVFITEPPMHMATWNESPGAVGGVKTPDGFVGYERLSAPNNVYDDIPDGVPVSPAPGQANTKPNTKPKPKAKPTKSADDDDYLNVGSRQASMI